MGECTPYGYTSGCYWNGHNKNDTIDNNQCTSDEYCGGNFGADIFDALAGERGTYLTVNQR